MQCVSDKGYVTGLRSPKTSLEYRCCEHFLYRLDMFINKWHDLHHAKSPSKQGSIHKI